jgi:polyhydroxyalkanoate synthesis regulator protein
MISRVYIYKKDNQIIIKRKGNNTCYCLYCASHSYFNVNDIKYFTATQKNTEYDYEFKVIDNNYNEDIILPVSGISEEAKDKILDFLNSLIQN